jgi:hypothetical protein
MRIFLCLVAVAVLAPCAVGAQTTTADGVQALIRGDYQTAVRILRPRAAEDAAQPDPLAQFFMAMLYDSGQGVTRNSMRACGLYLSAAKPANPLMNQSLELAQSMQLQWSGPFAGHLCSLAIADRWRDAPSASFTVGPGHSVTIDETGATVFYNGTQTHTTMARGGPGFVPFPIVHTQLDVSRPMAVRRHFIQFFNWSPYRPFDGSAWTLWWSLSEVVGPDLIPVTSDQGMGTVTALQPPMSFDVDSVAGVRVDENGEAEWVVLTGPNPRSGVIPFRRSR